MNKINTSFKTALLSIMMMACVTLVAQTPVQKYGKLQIKNGQVSDKDGNPIILRGMSLFWSGFAEGTQYYNAQTVKELRDEWCVDIVRAAMSVDEGNTKYLTNPNSEKAKIERVIDAAIANGIYVLVDFHTEEAIDHEDEARTFFGDIYGKYGNIPNLIYETYNEPVNKNWSTQLKPYHNRMISYIRGLGADNIIVCGTRNYSQEVAEAANDPVTGTNVAYTLHYYADTHKGALRTKAKNALNKGAALFVTEYGTVNALGNGNVNAAEAQTWWDFLEENKLSSCNWSVSNKNESASILKPGVNSLDNWNNSNYTQSGLLVKGYLDGKCGEDLISGSVTLSFAGNQTQYDAGETVSITATTTVSTNGSIGEVRFFDGDDLIGTDPSAPYTLSKSDFTPGGHDLVAKSYTPSGALVGVSPLYVISIVGASNVSTTGITDQFETADQFLELTGGINGASCATADMAAAAGIFWFEDRSTAGFTSVSSRTGDGTLKYTLTKSEGNFDVMGFVFGDYCDGNTKKSYTLDLSQNAVLKMTVEAPASNTETLDFKMQLKDINGNVVAIKNTALKPDGSVDTDNWWMHEIGFSKNHSAPDFLAIEPGQTVNFVYDFADALEVTNPNNPNFPADIQNNNDNFDFTQVSQAIFIPVNAEDTGAPSYAPLAFSNQQLIFSGLSLGDASLGDDICTTPPTVSANPVIYCEGESEVTSLFEFTTSIDAFPLKWYNTPTGGIGTEDAPIPSTSLPGTESFYVSQFVGANPSCEGSRTKVDVEIVAAPAVDAGIDQMAAEGPEIDLAGSGDATGTWTVESKPATAGTISFSPNASSANVVASGLDVVGDYSFTYTVTGTTAPCNSSFSDVVNVGVSSIVAIEDDVTKLGVTIFPNPVTDNLNINVSALDNTKSVQLLDVTGNVLFSSENKDVMNFNTALIPSGTYLVRITTEDNVYVKSIVK